MTATVQPIDLLAIDAEAAVEEITAALRHAVTRQLRRKGLVLGLSGGIDSSVCVALAARALGPDRVLGLLMPETDKDPETTRLGHVAADATGVMTLLEDIAPVLEAAGCYRRQQEAINLVLPEYGPGWKSKIVLPPLLDGENYRLFTLVAQSPDGEITKRRLSPEAYRGLVAATNMKQRVRKMLEYHHADRLGFAVLGTPNRLEYDQGFFVKNGDGSADVKPIAHLYKSQVYAIARTLGVPEEICSRPPTTDTYSLPQSQEEFYFSLPYDVMDRCLAAQDRGLTVGEAARRVGLSTDQMARVYGDIEAKRRAAAYLHEAPIVFGEMAHPDA
jgi:NAD+ synthase